MFVATLLSLPIILKAGFCAGAAFLAAPLAALLLLLMLAWSAADAAGFSDIRNVDGLHGGRVTRSIFLSSNVESPLFPEVNLNCRRTGFRSQLPDGNRYTISPHRNAALAL